jgi:hypothetical protein
MNFSDNWTPLVGGNVNVNLKLDKILEHIPVYLTRMNADLRKQASLGIEPFVSFVAGGIADKLDRHKA